MSKMVCSEIGEIDKYKAIPGCNLVRDVVTAVKSDVIVYPHVSSCLGVIFDLRGSPHGIDRVGAHLVVSASYGFGFDAAVNYYCNHRVLRQYCMNSRAYFFTPMQDWKGEVVKTLLPTLNISEYFFKVVPNDVNAWVEQDNLYLVDWNNNSNAAAESKTPLGSAQKILLSGVKMDQN